MSLYKMILVDDEEDVRVSIEKKVDWASLGFELVGSANNGEEALELTESRHVDVVLTDIQMPFMDGLTLCQKVKENYKNTKVVLYSGFDDFEFARKAIHLEAEEYLLKPIGARDLEKVFRRLKDNLDKEFDERRNVENLFDYYQKSLPMMREQLITGILEGKVSEAQARNMMETYGMDFSAPYYAVALIGADFEEKGGELQASQLFMLSLKNLAEEYLEKHMDAHVQMYLDKVIIIGKLAQNVNIQEYVYHINQICKIGARMLEVDVDGGIGHKYSSLIKIATSYSEAKTAFDYRILLEGSSQAIYINDVEPRTEARLFSGAQNFQKVLYSMKLGTKEELEAAIDEIIDQLRESKITVQQYQLTFMEILIEMLRLLGSYELEIEEVFGKRFDPYQEVGKLRSLDEVAGWLKDRCEKIFLLIRKERFVSTNMMTEKAKLYIEENYTDSRLSVEDLCNHLNVSATWFSVTFKREMGMSFISYLTQVRLEHAVELLDNTEDKSYMIAQKVGYTEANYFSYVFKKKYGVSPSKYRVSKGK
ncbi:MAG: response regulator [Lachnospiraceae bacterium]|nr:response regulator [Lachnospiraceae bacterium]MDY5699874.1 response regulator [Lachnospiraceae bacterium]